jgi:hypothetical protein
MSDVCIALSLTPNAFRARDVSVGVASRPETVESGLICR